VCGADHAPIYADADFLIQGYVDPTQLKPEGPFGDHLGYYARCHDFPLLKVTAVKHRPDAVWPMTVVGRPPQEDTIFGELIHELTGPVIPTVLPGVKAVHAVDAAGVHPLLLAVGSERYTPYAKPNRPQELLTQASAILGQGQLSLAKYLWITETSTGDVDIHDVRAFFQHVLARVDWSRDLHFHTRTTMDTLDYSGDGLNSGSKLVIAASGPERRELPSELPSLLGLPASWRNPHLVMPGVVCIEADRWNEADMAPRRGWQRECDLIDPRGPLQRWPLIVLVDDAEFAARSINNFVWVTFTRSNPAVDVYGLGATIIDKHFSVGGSLVIDARVKPHHAPPLIEDRQVTAKVDALASQNLPISKYL
jgi:4-hydroxy-3-polyprenylbenzoate decarboxylase